MAIREIRLSNDEILRKTSREVETVDDRIKELLDDMVETMHKYNGVGLAGPQVGGQIWTALCTSASGYSEALQRAWRRNCYSWCRWTPARAYCMGI